MAAENISFNVLKHVLVPEHHLTPDQLPKIRKSDPGIKVLESIHGPIDEGRVVKIVRKSETAEEFVAYRLVIRG